jgi:hypothetical protein
LICSCGVKGRTGQAHETRAQTALNYQVIEGLQHAGRQARRQAAPSTRCGQQPQQPQRPQPQQSQPAVAAATALAAASSSPPPPPTTTHLQRRQARGKRECLLLVCVRERVVDVADAPIFHHKRMTTTTRDTCMHAFRHNRKGNRNSSSRSRSSSSSSSSSTSAIVSITGTQSPPHASSGLCT